MREENQVRTAARVPRDLCEVAASKAYFCARHLPADEISMRLAQFRANRLAELDPYIRLGYLGRRGRDALMAQVDRGIAEGQGRAPRLPLSPGGAPRAFTPFRQTCAPLDIALISGWGLGHVRAVRTLAERLAASGHRVSCFSFLTGARARSVDFVNGVWLHRGGTWRLDHRRDGRPVIGRAARARAELDRIALRRRFDLVLHPAGLLSGWGTPGPGLSTGGLTLHTTLARNARMRPESAIRQLQVLAQPS